MICYNGGPHGRFTRDLRTCPIVIIITIIIITVIVLILQNMYMYCFLPSNFQTQLPSNFQTQQSIPANSLDHVQKICPYHIILGHA